MNVIVTNNAKHTAVAFSQLYRYVKGKAKTIIQTQCRDTIVSCYQWRIIYKENLVDIKFFLSRYISRLLKISYTLINICITSGTVNLAFPQQDCIYANGADVSVRDDRQSRIPWEYTDVNNVDWIQSWREERLEFALGAASRWNEPRKRWRVQQLRRQFLHRVGVSA